MSLPRQAAAWVPLPTGRAMHVVVRNALVTQRKLGPNIACLLLEAGVLIFGLGLGFAALVGEVAGMPYMTYFVSGMLVLSVAYAASYEAMDAAYTRFAVQRTWDSILLAPMHLTDVFVGELLWAAAKATVSGMLLLSLAAAMGYLDWLGILAVLPVLPLCALAYASLVMLFNSKMTSYDQHEYFYNCLQMPMVFLSGMMFPRENLPGPVAAVSDWLPLSKMVDLTRPLILGEVPDGLAGLLAYQVVMLVVCATLAHRILTRRLQR